MLNNGQDQSLNRVLAGFYGRCKASITERLAGHRTNRCDVYVSQGLLVSAAEQVDEVGCGGGTGKGDDVWPLRAAGKQFFKFRLRCRRNFSFVSFYNFKEHAGFSEFAGQ